MKNGIEKKNHVLFIFEKWAAAKREFTINELFDFTAPKFTERKYNFETKKEEEIKIPLTMSCFRFIIKALINEGKVKSRKQIIKSTGSKAPVYLISRKTTKTKTTK